MSEKRQGLLFVLIGPPGAGKNALMNDALARDGQLRQLATATTRAIRPTEQQGREHLFTDTATFNTMIDSGALLEWQQVHGNLYGIPRRILEDAFANGQDLTADIDVLGATYIRSLYPNNVVLIFIAPPEIAALETRMRTRGETETEIGTRMKRVTMEMTYAPLCDYIIINDDLQQAAAKLNDHIQAERQRQMRHENRTFEYHVSVIPLYEAETLVNPDNRFPEGTPRYGEMPHQTTLRLMNEIFNIENPSADQLFEAAPHAGSFIPPVMVEGDGKRVHFTYAYLLPEHITPPADWHWLPVSQANLPQSILDVIFKQVSA